MTKCFFCQYKTKPSYKDIENVEKFLSIRKKILGRDKTGVCAKHQRLLTKAIKYARYLALLPYVSYQGLR
ncbi:30S ribosomal protein S18 [Candidatus Roizmanbacteria bacterium RIFCSPHIGHO2_02_FULL_37_15]|uniref:Small ribosomal subunit protein bS18 n=1 Tax=Candidatus Roizmanbacteria bacterium RIFCSPLOWO2_01_FULL_37_16 TaxID=1802058 RepID=A0A1F7IQG5_9BACT|nr:MAG: 30S ribosomal protein S18 [Candidatus Roizmanbacteria bacterium RIFCSPHIGHO2_01_FULL_37_16b]OGK21126.1 MAG: 30S ribosomal protein S18 [Candidatus Roizmanbacteria bacterium RIFCSPHIGHO2_02_FULL_37_15]OGK31484.1 MAG: 30S ribosomal protein S18 [Candidatus Roizmanbacteria bacterium RIFCSPHIGHO2_12_FULL_36_11]OGK45604.1 MAG: 30S ribosomal protein S18 [Candidatus Roizmanbacteria bacterium RIFCSPLOWO2_01_FULL_37_16]OGK56001.1 MAG: 30S ribosomal protein S18 [Candidatus Roizmanbacteria bacterium